jgi:hypothetical protein
MDEIWIATVEVEVQREDVPSGDTFGFMRITMWASSRQDFLGKLERYFSEYGWRLISVDNVELVERSKDYTDEVNQMIDETSQDHDAVRLGTFFSYKQN